MPDNKKILVAYFSCSGVTAKAARALADVTGADLYEIRPKAPYSSADLNWNNPSSRSSVEMSNPSARPELAGELPDLAEYNSVFIGFPIWWYVAPRIINTFLERCDFSGKTIIPFATSGGSGLGKAEEKLQADCVASAVWRPGKLLNGSVTNDTLTAWVSGLRL